MATQDDPHTEAAATTESTTTEATSQSPKQATTESGDRQRSASPAGSDSQPSSVTSPTSTERDATEAEASDEPDGASQAHTSTENAENNSSSAPPLPSEPVPGQTAPSEPPLPTEPAPQPEDDGWEYHWNASTSSYWFYNRFTQVWQENNPRIPTYGSTAPGVPSITTSTTAPAPIIVAGQPISDPTSVAGGYNPAIHGDYDPNAWYAQAARAADEPPVPSLAPGEVSDNIATAGFFNRATGAWQRPEQGPERHSDEAKSRRQLNNFFDVDAAANEHDGRSLKAERSGKKPSKAELKAYKEKRRARKEEKRRAWLRD
jgi:hypothetical protein